MECSCTKAKLALYAEGMRSLIEVAARQDAIAKGRKGDERRD